MLDVSEVQSWAPPLPGSACFTMRSARMNVSLSIRVTVPAPSRKPDCIQLRINKEGFSLFPCVANLKTIPLKERNWALIASNMLECHVETMLSLNIRKIIEKSRERPLRFSLDCMRGRKVQYKMRQSVWWFIDLLYQQQHAAINVTYPNQIYVTSESEAAVDKEISQKSSKESLWRCIPEQDTLQPVQTAQLTRASTSRSRTHDKEAPRNPDSARQSVAPPNVTQDATDVVPKCYEKIYGTLNSDVKSPRQVRSEDSETLTINPLGKTTAQAAAGNIERKNLRSLPRPQPQRYAMWMNWFVANIMPPAMIYYVLLDFIKSRLGEEVTSPVPLMMWLLIGMSCLMFYYSSWVPPGQVLKKDWRIWKKTDTWRKCEYCEIHVPPVARHCSVCKVCIWERDHHCYVIGNCVGRDNVKAFLMLCVMAWTCAFSCLSLTMAKVISYKEKLVFHDWVIIIGSLTVLSLCTFLCINVRNRRGRWKKRFPKYFG